MLPPYIGAAADGFGDCIDESRLFSPLRLPLVMELDEDGSPSESLLSLSLSLPLLLLLLVTLPPCLRR